MRARTALAAALATAFLLAGCSATSGTDTAVEGGAPGVSNDMMVTEEMPAAEAMPADGKAATTPSVTTERQVIRTGYVSMQVDDVTKSAFDVHGLIKKRNGLISSEDTQSSGDMTYSTITAQIPAADLDAFIADVSALGTVDLGQRQRPGRDDPGRRPRRADQGAADEHRPADRSSWPRPAGSRTCS